MNQIENCNTSGHDIIISSQVKLGLLKGFVMFMTGNFQLKMCKTEVPNFEDLKTVLPSIVPPPKDSVIICIVHSQLTPTA